MSQLPSIFRSPIVSLNGNPPLFRRAAGCVGAAAHDDNREGDIFAGRNRKLLDVERLRRPVIPEEQIPCFPVLIHSARLQRRRHVEHHDILFMMGKNGGKIMPADRVRPCFHDRRDLILGRSVLLRHGSRSGCLPDVQPGGRTSECMSDTPRNFFQTSARDRRSAPDGVTIRPVATAGWPGIRRRIL